MPSKLEILPVISEKMEKARASFDIERIKNEEEKKTIQERKKRRKKEKGELRKIELEQEKLNKKKLNSRLDRLDTAYEASKYWEEQARLRYDSFVPFKPILEAKTFFEPVIMAGPRHPGKTLAQVEAKRAYQRRYYRNKKAAALNR
jgi:hypothetical protein